MTGRILLMVLFLFGSAEAAFRHTKEIRLKKDEVQKMQVLTRGVTYPLEFRWTLYKNGGLVLHRNYDRFNFQNVLRLNHRNQSIRIEIDMSGGDPRQFTYIVLKFKTFDFSAQEAVFDLLLRDEGDKVILNYLNNTTDEENP